MIQNKNKNLIVVKFGGTSVADVARIQGAAQKVAAEVKRGNKVVCVVSAMAGVTNQLISYCQNAYQGADLTSQPAYDAVVASGEQVTSGLMALVLQQAGVAAQSFQGWQVPIVTSTQHGKARITDIKPEILHDMMDKGIVPIVAGFQGATEDNKVTTLGRGGSDTTAVALAAALNAERCDIYTDVDGVYTTDPRIVPEARKINRISYEEMLELASLGAKVLHARSVELAMAYHVPVQVLSTFDAAIGSDIPGTLVTNEEEIMEQQIVNGVAYAADEAKVTLIAVPDVPGVAASVFGPLADAGVNVDMIVQNISSDGKTTDMTFTLPRNELAHAREVLAKVDTLKGCEVRAAENVAKISVVGIGMKSHSGVAQAMFKALAGKGINIQVITTSEIKISVLVERDYMELAVRALHSAYGLDKQTA